MKSEGLHVPIIVIPSHQPDHFFIRAGFRRTAAARLLRWKQIPAIILPQDTPVVSEYWTNVVENSARDRLTSFEVANAARTMRDKFGVKAPEFARKAGFSESYVLQLLRCLDRLPQPIIDVWRDRAPIPVALYDKWSNLDPDSAIKQMLIYRGRNPKIVGDWQPPTSLKLRAHPIKMASAAGLRRMQRLRFAIEVARSLDEKTRKLGLDLVDFCSGAKDSVSGIYDNSVKQRMYKSRRKEDLAQNNDLHLPDLEELTSQNDLDHMSDDKTTH